MAESTRFRERVGTNGMVHCCPMPLMTIHKSVPLHAASSAATPSVPPLLKWAGGKRQLLPALNRLYPARFGRYVEPFFGSGAVFFDLQNTGRLDGRSARLADVNPDLIGCYLTLR